MTTTWQTTRRWSLSTSPQPLAAHVSCWATAATAKVRRGAVWRCLPATAGSLNLLCCAWLCLPYWPCSLPWAFSLDCLPTSPHSTPLFLPTHAGGFISGGRRQARPVVERKRSNKMGKSGEHAVVSHVGSAGASGSSFRTPNAGGGRKARPGSASSSGPASSSTPGEAQLRGGRLGRAKGGPTCLAITSAAGSCWQQFRRPPACLPPSILRCPSSPRLPRSAHRCARRALRHKPRRRIGIPVWQQPQRQRAARSPQRPPGSHGCRNGGCGPQPALPLSRSGFLDHPERLLLSSLPCHPWS